MAYWIDKKLWGKGLCSMALGLFLGSVNVMGSIYGRVAKDNIGSQRVLEKNGFQLYAHDKGFAENRGEEVEECLFKLDCVEV